MLRHLVVFLPGIMGSILQKDGRDVWAPSRQALWTLFETGGNALTELQVAGEDGRTDDLGDGIRADRLVRDTVLQVPRLIEHSGYGPLLDQLPEFLEIRPGSVLAPRDEASFYPFPYDWRRDNRVSARRLQRFVENQLPRWRDWSGAQDAKVILIGHSMGGLVARYYVEVLGGWKHTLALITIGSPHRGSLGALDMLSNGIPKLKRIFDVGQLVRSFESAYQLLPTYRALQVDDDYLRVVEAPALPNIDPARAAAARQDFFEAMRLAREVHLNEPGYDPNLLVPWVGTRQETWQSARLQDGRITASYAAPPGLAPELADGDGTVPRISAIPAALEGKRLERFAAERHGWLTNNPMCLDPLLQTIRQIGAGRSSTDFHGSVDGVGGASIGLGLEGLFACDETPTAILRVYEARRPMVLRVSLQPTAPECPRQTLDLTLQPDESRTVAFETLAPGQYVLTVSPADRFSPGPPPVHGVFEVLP